MLRTSGAEWKAFCASLPDGWMHEDDIITVDGKSDDGNMDLDNVPDNSVMTISGGILFLDQTGKDGKSLEYSIRCWRKRAGTTRIVVEVSKDKENDVREAVEKAGGKCIG